MGSEWREITLEDALEFVVDNRGKTVPVSDLGVALIATNCVSNNNLYPEHINVRHVAQETYNNWFRSHPQPNDILLTNKGSKNGAVCLVPDPVDFCIAQDMVALRADRSKIDPSYLFAALRSPNIQAQIKQLNVDSVIPHFKKTDFDKLYIPLPAEDEQKQIGSIYLNFSKKIELNRQMNATLEGMAQALFKSWFVDFDPVIDNALAAGNPIPDALAARAEIRRQLLADGRANREAAKPFPATFHFTEELGWIPEGWEVRSIGTIAKAAGGYAFKSKVFRESGYPVVKIKNIVGNGTVSLSDTQCIGIEDAHMAEKFSLEDGNLLMAMTGATVGKIGLVVNENQPAYLNQRVAKLEGRNIENLSPFLFCFFREQSNFAQIVGLASGSAQPNISASGIESIPCAIPDNDQHTVFTGLVEPHFEKWISNHRLFVNLANLRDTLLPKLISGELRIPDAEKLVAEAL